MKIIETGKYKQAQLNPLDGKSNAQARTIVNKIIPKMTGIYSDQSWEGVAQIWNAFDNAGLNWAMTDSQYLKDERQNPTAKTWKFEVYFSNNKGIKRTIQISLTTATSILK